jgi:hypothetical protein
VSLVCMVRRCRLLLSSCSRGRGSCITPTCWVLGQPLGVDSSRGRGVSCTPTLAAAGMAPVLFLFLLGGGGPVYASW